MNNQSMILIPAYQPTDCLVNLVQEVKQQRESQQIIIVNDGSTTIESKQAFEALSDMGIAVISHASNQGKGAALKTGIQYFLTHSDFDSPGVVTADADGQHCADDILRVCSALENKPRALYLGVRKFDNKTPLRSRFGNILTGFIFRQMSHTDLHDTQTGLRGLPRSFAKHMLETSANGYEFELDMLMQATQQQLPLAEVAIKTIYEDNNASSHFNPILDSLKIYFVFARFLFVSALTGVVDFLIFGLVYFFSNQIFLSICMGRIIAGILNYNLGKRFSFKDCNVRDRTAVIQYCLLVITMGLLSYFLLKLLSLTKTNIYIGKIVVETSIYLLNFTIQRLIIFKREPKP